MHNLEIVNKHKAICLSTFKARCVNKQINTDMN